MVAPALLSAGASILGGLFGRSKSKYVIPPYAKIRAAAEAAGINPLFALSNAPGSVVTEDNSSLGQGIANAGATLAESLNRKRQPAVVNEQLHAENAALQTRVQSLTLRPPAPGLFQRGGVGDLAERADNGSRAVPSRALPMSNAVGSLRLDPIVNYSSWDSRREIDVMPVQVDPGHTVVDNPHLPGPVNVISVNGETDLSTLAVVAGSTALQYPGWTAQKILSGVPMPRQSRLGFDQTAFDIARGNITRNRLYESRNRLPMDYYPFRRPAVRP